MYIDPTITRVLWLAGAAVGLTLTFFTVRAIRRRRGGTMKRLEEELGFRRSGDARRPTLVAAYRGVMVAFSFEQKDYPRLHVAIPLGTLPEGLELRDSGVKSGTAPASSISFEGTVFVGPLRRWAELLDPTLLAGLDTVGRYWSFEHLEDKLVLRPKVQGVFEDFEWLTKTLDRVTGLVKAADELRGCEEPEQRLQAHAAAASTPELKDLYARALDEPEEA